MAPCTPMEGRLLLPRWPMLGLRVYGSEGGGSVIYSEVRASQGMLMRNDEKLIVRTCLARGVMPEPPLAHPRHRHSPYGWTRQFSHSAKHKQIADCWVG